MDFTNSTASLFLHTDIPNIFFTEYMPNLDGESVRVYLMCSFLAGMKSTYDVANLASMLSSDTDAVRASLTVLETAGLLTWSSKRVDLADIQEKELLKQYTLRETKKPSAAAGASNKARNQAISVINDTYFRGVMSTSWYTDISSWFDRFSFDPDVMVMLFQQCSKYNGLNKSYLLKVAESWHVQGIKTQLELDSYLTQHSAFRCIYDTISKRLNLSRRLSTYEEDIVRRWCSEYGYDMGIIELALQRTTQISKPSFKYIDKIITVWHENNLKTAEAVSSFEVQNSAEKAVSGNFAKNSVTPKGNFTGRKYDDNLFEELCNDDNNR